MQYSISHQTNYHYAAPVLQSYHLLHLAPRDIPHQVTHRHRLLVEPVPASRQEDVDYFGNPVTVLNLESTHSELVINASSQIEVTQRTSPNLAKSSDWLDVARNLPDGTQVTGNGVAEFAAPSRNARPTPALADYARPSFPQGRPVLEAASDLTRRIFEDFAFDATATDVSTPVEEVLQNRRGVCQDFAHLQIAALRSLGLPARYVSGYIMTHPPEGKAKLQGTDASHAWVSVWAPETGWVDFDPTNNLIPDLEHITIAFGRDYDDVSPIGGVLLGGGSHTVTVAVDVAPTTRSGG